MTGALKPYPKYKESGVEWLGRVPEGWEVVSSKRVVSIVSGATPSSTNELYWDGEIVWYTPSDLSNLADIKINGSTRFITSEGLASCGAELVPENSIILATRAPIGPVALTNVPACTNQGCKALVPTSDIQPRYLTRYIAAQSGILNMLGRGSTFLELPTRELSQFPVPLPPLPEQQAIADYLDAETQRIDTLIAELREMIRLLKEKRQALISHCVTKGLDPTVPMKDSGVEWLGEVPEGWTLTTLGRIAARIQTGPFGSQIHSYEYVFGGIPLINPAHIVGGEIVPDMNCTVTGEQATEFDQYRLQNGDIVLGRRGEMGRCATVSDESSGFLIGTGSLSIRLHEGQESKYWAKFLSIPRIRDWLALEANGSTILNLNETIVSRIPIVAPPAEEQRAIATDLDTETAKIDRLISETEDTITLMQERRLALISSVVTGKLQVPGFAEPGCMAEQEAELPTRPSGSTLSPRPENLQ
jgi:type I restriction enzyme, S subunit